PVFLETETPRSDRQRFEELHLESQVSRGGQRISRRKVLIGLAAGGVVVAGGGITWLVVSQGVSSPNTYRGHSDYNVNSVDWAPGGQYIASASTDNTVQIWNAADGGNIYTYRGHADTVVS